MMANVNPIVSTSSIVGNKVKNHQGEELGAIKELMVDAATGRIVYAVLDFGGFLGIGNKLFAVPWPALTVSTEDRYVRMEADRELLSAADGFDQNDWPDFVDQNWAARIHAHYNATPYWHQ